MCAQQSLHRALSVRLTSLCLLKPFRSSLRNNLSRAAKFTHKDGERKHATWCKFTSTWASCTTGRTSLSGSLGHSGRQVSRRLWTQSVTKRASSSRYCQWLYTGWLWLSRLARAAVKISTSIPPRKLSPNHWELDQPAMRENELTTRPWLQDRCKLISKERLPPISQMNRQPSGKALIVFARTPRSITRVNWSRSISSQS